LLAPASRAVFSKKDPDPTLSFRGEASARKRTRYALASKDPLGSPDSQPLIRLHRIIERRKLSQSNHLIRFQVRKKNRKSETNPSSTRGNQWFINEIMM